MNAFVPPRPVATEQKASPLARARQFLNSGLSLFLRGSYDFIGVSRHPLPRIPFRPRRIVYLARDPNAIRQVLVSDAARFPKSHLIGFDAAGADRLQHLRLERRGLAAAARDHRSGVRERAGARSVRADARRLRRDGGAARGAHAREPRRRQSTSTSRPCISPVT